MPTRLLHYMPVSRRDALFAELRRMVNEVDAIDRSLEHYGEGEGMAVDETLEAICSLFRREAKRVKKSKLALAA